MLYVVGSVFAGVERGERVVVSGVWCVVMSCAWSRGRLYSKYIVSKLHQLNMLDMILMLRPLLKKLYHQC